ncbi:DUF1694 domain-containing protein [Streptococcus sp. DD10]|uniref:DUF1694 domain-containing protein n=1 Tax=Streptococcus sp. DD10 TaxID=1777878 RepID=UPI0018D33159|nr:DUF1694 domain-containing protein [Streptococcus sp. DD10]
MNKLILEKAHGANRLNPDEQKKYLETFFERVIAIADIDEANSSILSLHFEEILQKLGEHYQPLFVKISPNVETTSQVSLMKIAHSLNIQTTIVSEECHCSPYGIVIHSDHPVKVDSLELKIQFSSLLTPGNIQNAQQAKRSFWNKFFTHKNGPSS